MLESVCIKEKLIDLNSSKSRIEVDKDTLVSKLTEYKKHLKNNNFYNGMVVDTYL